MRNDLITSTSLNSKEEQIRDFLIDDFIPKLKDYFETVNHEAFVKWHRNFCAQAAISSKSLLDIVLPEYNWVVKCKIFKDNIFNEDTYYNHCYLIGTCKFNNKALLVDVEREPFHKNVFDYIDIEHIDNPYLNIEEYQSMSEISVVSELDGVFGEKFKECICNTPEYFSGRIFKYVIMDLLSSIKKDFSSEIFEEFINKWGF